MNSPTVSSALRLGCTLWALGCLTGGCHCGANHPLVHGGAEAGVGDAAVDSVDAPGGEDALVDAADGGGDAADLGLDVGPEARDAAVDEDAPADAQEDADADGCGGAVCGTNQVCLHVAVDCAMPFAGSCPFGSLHGGPACCTPLPPPRCVDTEQACAKPFTCSCFVTDPCSRLAGTCSNDHADAGELTCR